MLLVLCITRAREKEMVREKTESKGWGPLPRDAHFVPAKEL